MACWSERGDCIELHRSQLMSNSYVLKAASAIHFGLPVLNSRANRVHRRTMTERLAVAERRINPAERARRLSGLLGDPHCPVGVPKGIHPKLVTKLAAQRFGINS